MYAIIENGGRQFRVTPGKVVRLGKLAGDVGSEIELGGVLAVARDDNQLLTGGDVESSRVKATILRHDREKKITVFKFKRKKQYKRTIGHRQDFTEVRVNEIV
jgi:large subunit ribosomal protein L21